MASIRLQAKPVLDVNIEIGGVRIRERDDLALVSVAGATSLDWLEMPTPTMSTEAGDMRAISIAQDQVMLIFQHRTPDAERVVRKRLNDGYTTDQTDVWVVLEVEGPYVRDGLERICPLDLHPEEFSIGSAARTVMEHMGAMIVRTGTDRFLLLSARSSAKSFLHAVETSFKNVA
ncbi:MAG: sarcosine oxidase subunit gamma family protein [Pseudomonadota bacterium]